jgi:orotate phosphoribosyltransferase
MLSNNPGKVMKLNTPINQMKQELIDILCHKSFKYSEKPDFKLVSGKLSRFYINCKPTTLSPRGMFLTGHLVFDAIKDQKIRAAGGLTFGADPVSIAAAFASELQNEPIKAFSIRKTKKAHGIVNGMDGSIMPAEQ